MSAWAEVASFCMMMVSILPMQVVLGRGNEPKRGHAMASRNVATIVCFNHDCSHVLNAAVLITAYRAWV
jgi:hypothetical protein